MVESIPSRGRVMIGNLTSFRDAIVEKHGAAPEVIPINDFARFGPKKNLWAILSSDGNSCSFGDWRTGEKHTVFAGRCNKHYSNRDIATAKRNATEAKRTRDIETARQQLRLESVVSSVFQNGAELPAAYCYLVQKQIEIFAGIFRLGKDGRAIAPLEIIEGRHVNNQYITKTGKKYFHPGARVAGSFCTVQKTVPNAKIIICEGIATACSVATIEPNSTTLAAMNAGNIFYVATTVRAKNPRNRIIIVGDNDRFTHGNPGRTKAIEAARAVGGEYVIPEFPPGVNGTDFNDLMCAGCLS